MKNRNAFAAWVAAHVLIGVEALVRRYAHAELTSFWTTEITSDVATLVLLIGRDGVRGAISRLVSFAKTLWSGQGASGVETT